MRAAMPSERIGWGFLGSGGISTVVAREIAEAGGTRLLSVFGHHAEQAHDFARAHGFAHVSADPAALLREDGVDAVYVALPHSLHVPALLQALDAGKHVLCEKPLGLSATEVAQVRAHPASTRFAIAEGFMVRHHPQWQWIGQVLRDGVIGDVRSVQIHSCLNLPAPLNGPKLPGQNSLLLDIGCYGVHLTRFIFGREPTGVSARLDLADDGIRDTFVGAQFDFADGIAQLVVSGEMFPSRRIHVLGTKGEIEIFNPVHPGPDGTATVRLATPTGVEDRVFPRALQYALQFQEFEQAIVEGRLPMVSLSDAAGNARAIDGIRASAARKGERVLLPTQW